MKLQRLSPSSDLSPAVRSPDTPLQIGVTFRDVRFRVHGGERRGPKEPKTCQPPIQSRTSILTDPTTYFKLCMGVSENGGP